MLLAAAQTAHAAAAPRRVFFDARAHQTGYAGPGREDDASEAATEVLIGYFGPSDPSAPEGGGMWLAAQMAIEEANRKGTGSALGFERGACPPIPIGGQAPSPKAEREPVPGFDGKPFRLVPAWSEATWGSGVVRLTRLVYGDKVWAIVGGIDGPSTHLAEQVVAKARLPLVSPVATDKTVNLANVPWMFSLAPGDHLLAPPLAAAIAEQIGRRPLILVSANDHDSRLFTAELRRAMEERRTVPVYQFECRAGGRDLGDLAARVTRSAPAAVAVVAGASDSARCVAALRSGGFAGPIFGGPAMGRSRFVQEAGKAAEGVVFPVLCERPNAGGFAEAFQARSGGPPDYAAARTYDAVRLLVAAIRKAGLNRARIADALRELSPWTGVAGEVRWDRLGSNLRGVRLGVIWGGYPQPVGPIR